MVTFTLPAQLRPLCRYQSKPFLNAFFAASAQAIKDVLEQPRHLGGSSGFFGVLQTWTQDLRLHPHIHYVVPAAALNSKGKLKRPKKQGWLARGDVFAARLKTLLIKALLKEHLLTPHLKRKLWTIQWNCDVESFGNGTNAIKYLGAYLSKGPVSDSRILDADDDQIRLSVKNRKTGNHESIDLTPTEFVRRYLQHALPHGFHAIRYFGFIHPRSKRKLNSIRQQLGVKTPEKTKNDNQSAQEPPIIHCPRCQKPMEMTAHLSRAPPSQRTLLKIWNPKQKIPA